VGLNALKSLNLTNVYPNNNKNNNKKNNNNKIKSKPLELFELAGKNLGLSGIIDNSTTINICCIYKLCCIKWAEQYQD
jgi:hypothetical protein